ncbi:MAG: trypsin-like peptidase domain-containing protein [Planctomycetes bacterium]|nr:trypsin-like peptidase domain-containing protein [Planctomycetota bacterium]
MNRLSLALAFAFILAGLAPGGRAADDAGTAPALASALSEAFGSAAERIAPCVVAVDVDRDKDIPGFEGRNVPEELKEYYRRPAGPASGVIVSEDGLILTSQYNVAGEVRGIRVTTGDGRAREARILGTDDWDDLALLKVDAKGLPVPVWADPVDLRVGRFVAAVGRSPDRSRPTVNAGIVSALHRKDSRLLQTDAAFDYGNSGGALVDLDGRLVGLIAFVGHRWPDWGMNGGVGLAVRVDAIREVLPLLQRGESIPFPEMPFMGIGQDARAIDVAGAKVETVMDGTGAKAAGLRPGDIIVAIDGEPVTDWDAMVDIVWRRKPGQEIEVTVRRGEDDVALRLTLGRRPR